MCVHAAGGMTTTFSSNDEVLAYIGNQILTPTWVDPVCGDGNCEYPWEFPAWLQVRKQVMLCRINASHSLSANC